jgi:uncharacterized protein YjeT (DUF2065 family)
MIPKRNFILIITFVAFAGIFISEFIDQVVHPFLSLQWIVIFLSLYLVIIGIYTLLYPKRVRDQINQSSDSTIQWIGIFIIIIGIFISLLLFIRALLFQIRRML